MSGRKHHLLRDHRNLVDYRQVPVSVPVPIHDPAPVRALPHTDYKQTEPTPLGKERNLLHEREQVRVARRDESMLVFFNKPIRADTDQFINQFPACQKDWGSKSTATMHKCVSERDTCTECPWIYQQHHNSKERTQFFYFLSPFL